MPNYTLVCTLPWKTINLLGVMPLKITFIVAMKCQ